MRGMTGARELVRAAYSAGCRRFDAAIGGLGGCPFAQDVLVGNLATEVVLEELKALGAELPQLGPLDALIVGECRRLRGSMGLRCSRDSARE